MFQQKAGANTPRVRPATHFDFLRLNDALEPLNAGATAGVVTQFRQAKTTFENILLMDFAEGQTIMRVMDEDPQRLGEALKDRQFQFSLGRLLAADALSGNPDRAMAITTKGGGVRGWYHEQNLFIHQTEGTWGKYAAVAIDNAFAPTVTNMTKPFGKILGAGVQYGSMAAASTGHFEEEAGLLYDRILEELLKRHDDVAELVGDLRPHRAEFADNVARTAELVMNNTIGKHGQGWKQQLRKGGATEENIQDFSHRKRYMRLLRLGCEPELAHEVALDDTAYHKFILTEEKGYSETKAEATLKRGKSAYRRAKNS
jgi:hypothetical protein